MTHSKPRIKMKYHYLLLPIFLMLGITACSSLDSTSSSPERTSTSPLVSEQHWANCGQEGQPCKLPSHTKNKFVTVRYGNEGQYNFRFLSGLDSFTCDNGNGDPLGAKSKQCSYRTNIYDYVIDTASKWNNAANEGEDFTVETVQNPGTSSYRQRWARMGGDNKWAYRVIDANKHDLVSCDVHAFGTDALPFTNKTCEIGPLFKDTNRDYRECAGENDLCSPDHEEPYLVKYYHKDRSVIRVVRMSNEFRCDNNLTGYDPYGLKNKFCQILTIFNPSAISTGKWERIQGCENCSETSFEASVGTTRTNKWDTNKEWAATVKVSIEQSGGIEVKGFTGGQKATASASASFAHSESFSKALESKKMEKLNFKCDEGSKTTSIDIYQFHTKTVDKSCIYDGDCEGNTYVKEYLCAYDSPAGYTGPQCLPTYCGEDQSKGACTVCDYGTSEETVGI